ncbi:DUF3618 domain-containing protein [Labedaea rhizosphaerae]|uniref:Uncharacterized protein DUF3618 n=1 Tax=Labedaea rhizosphaerae TaxID=598644 RepID=A0A4R6RSV3_LABRH|nr:DUF3618 domain-containing protein [Labedaea rhizosphaerae]TDP89953.1 uncharacterized protein DUF3618 [Labedaea rhizosphaerae]
MTKQTEPSQAELRSEIETTRAQVGDTVEALTRKLDVSARGKEKAAQLRADVLSKTENVVAALPEPAAAPVRRGVGAVVAHPGLAVGAFLGSALVVRSFMKRRNR